MAMATARKVLHNG